MLSPARRVMRDPPTSEHIIENVTSKGRESRDVCAAGADTRLLQEKLTTKAPGHRAPTAAPLGQLQHIQPARMLQGTCSPQPRKLSASRGERGASTLTHVPLLPPDPLPRTRSAPKAQRTGPTSPPAPAGEHRSVTPSPASRAVRDAPTSDHKPGHPNLRQGN